MWQSSLLVSVERLEHPSRLASLVSVDLERRAVGSTWEGLLTWECLHYVEKKQAQKVDKDTRAEQCYW